MTAAKKAAPSAPTTPTNAYEQTQQLIAENKKTGLLGPLLSELERLLQDPALKKTMQGMPPSGDSPKRPEEIN